MADLDLLRRHLLGMGRVLLGYSGGVDSALLAVVAREALGRDRLLAVIGRSASYPEVQWRSAVELAGRFDVPLLEIETRELEDPRYVSNPTNRCYFCKSELWTRLTEVARGRKFDVVVDGTNADDLGEHRPGLAAAEELGIRSPLAELGWSKSEIRAASLELGLPTWDAPAAPCLSSRVLYGLEVTPERLRQVEAGEAYLRALGVTGDLRVRHLDARARLEVGADQMELLRGEWDGVQAFFLSLGFLTVELDPQGYRRGGLLAMAPRIVA
ncbi:MAG: ATP-dependent sacrificial sulfur transferase LarE [Gemmatimonadales bacterium]|nr:ATP-dependent sacrificial sulfur transferase LarE [Gemmatimonadales bacterium]MDQ3426226.1 ATP-dependent sacrificial sulfur transferase LarE [Gemmatimonadota bacterium]